MPCVPYRICKHLKQILDLPACRDATDVKLNGMEAACVLFVSDDLQG